MKKMLSHTKPKKVWVPKKPPLEPKKIKQVWIPMNTSLVPKTKLVN